MASSSPVDQQSQFLDMMQKLKDVLRSYPMGAAWLQICEGLMNAGVIVDKDTHGVDLDEALDLLNVERVGPAEAFYKLSDSHLSVFEPAPQWENPPPPYLGFVAPLLPRLPGSVPRSPRASAPVATVRPMFFAGEAYRALQSRMRGPNPP